MIGSMLNGWWLQIEFNCTEFNANTAQRCRRYARLGGQHSDWPSSWLPQPMPLTTRSNWVKVTQCSVDSAAILQDAPQFHSYVTGQNDVIWWVDLMLRPPSSRSRHFPSRNFFHLLFFLVYRSNASLERLNRCQVQGRLQKIQHRLLWASFQESHSNLGHDYILIVLPPCPM